MNDPQRPIWIDGAYHFYYLYNDQYPHRRTKSWRHVSTHDGLRFGDHGVAIERDSEPNGLLMSGSVVVDADGSAGLGAGALVALVTQPDQIYGGGAQAQFLWYSTDRGYSFRSLGGPPVIANPGRRDFRDPKLMWDPASEHWICVLAEGHELGFYASTDLRNWTPTSRLHEGRFGILECPDIFRIRADDATSHWVLATSAKQVDDSMPPTYGYWTGEFDGRRFTPDNPDPRWLDHGFDWYAAVTWPIAHHDEEDTDLRWAIGWMNNWAYADHAPTFDEEGFNGTASIVRELRLSRTHAGEYVLRSDPVPTFKPDRYVFQSTGQAFVGLETLDVRSRCFYAEMALPTRRNHTVGMRTRLSDDRSRWVEVGVTQDAVYVDRSRGGDPSEGRFGRSEVPVGVGRVTLRVLVDHTSIEVFVNGLDVTTNLTFSRPEDIGIAVFGARSSHPITGDIRISLVD